MYPPIPIFSETLTDEAGRVIAEPLTEYAARALTHILEHGTAGVPDEALRQAVRIATIATAGPGIAPAAARRITDAAKTIRLALAVRADLETRARRRLSEILPGPPAPPAPPAGGRPVTAPRTPPPRYPPPALAARPALAQPGTAPDDFAF